MVTFPNCKINLGLNILKKREDGFHDLETFFLPVALCDALEILPSNKKTTITVTGIPAGKAEDNLCLKAFYLLKKDYALLPEVQIHLHKIIPIGAGLGGGSADAAFTLQLLNKKFELNIAEDKIFDYALELGSDCPFFLINKPAYATGRGEQFEHINLSLSGYKIALVNAGIHVSTADAFKNIKPGIPIEGIKDIIQQPIETWKEALKNDFEKYVFEKFPQVKKIKEDLYNAGAAYASMSGSGSTVFGIFKNNCTIIYSPEPAYFLKEINL
ncbi:MAG: 4-(cytidine 5'-diphospho)-2-C-methyl-D-erythritol kinase [Bacteroidota bacterium]|nr:4-(cytidine 5'-diphospho)-2-C-methyl-D-erythritol kinase [Bacteroidota bacterium]